MDWNQGYISKWMVERIDPQTWEPCGVLDGVENISVESDSTDDAPLLETASVTVTRPALDSFESGWYRITMQATQGAGGAVIPIATIWLDPTRSRYDKGYREDSLSGKSVLWQASEEKVGDGKYAPKGADGAEFVASLLEAVIDAPVNIEGGFSLEDHVVFDLDASVLEAAWAVLNAGNHVIQIDGRGEVHILPMPTTPSLVVDRSGACGLMPEVSVEDGKAVYEREFMPDVRPFSMVRCSLPEHGLPEGMYRVTSQKLKCDKGILVEESVEVVE